MKYTLIKQYIATFEKGDIVDTTCGIGVVTTTQHPLSNQVKIKLTEPTSYYFNVNFELNVEDVRLITDVNGLKS